MPAFRAAITMSMSSASRGKRSGYGWQWRSMASVIGISRPPNSRVTLLATSRLRQVSTTYHRIGGWSRLVRLVAVEPGNRRRVANRRRQRLEVGSDPTDIAGWRGEPAMILQPGAGEEGNDREVGERFPPAPLDEAGEGGRARRLHQDAGSGCQLPDRIEDLAIGHDLEVSTGGPDRLQRFIAVERAADLDPVGHRLRGCRLPGGTASKGA